MGVRIWAWRRQKGSTHEDIGAECEAFLRGTYVEYLASLDRAIPNWAWLNTLAHGTPPEIEALGRGTTATDDLLARESEWRRVVAFLASETLLVARISGHSITEIQKAVLADIELGLAQRASARALRPEELVELTLTALQSRLTRRSQRKADPKPRR